MKRQLRNHVAALCLLAPAAFTFTALPGTAIARPAAPEVNSLEIASDNGVNPGSLLRFTMEGTPRGRASVRIRGVREPIALRETERGIYTGQYTVRRGDDIDTGDKIRAILRHGNRTVTASYDVPPGLRTAAAAPPPPPLRIERFQVSTLERVLPGAEINFVVEGLPGATALVALPGIANPVQLREVRPGQYEGSYTIRRADRLDPNGAVVATLRAGKRAVTAKLNHPLVVADNRAEPDNRPPVVRDLSPREGEVVTGSPTVVSGRFGDRGGSGVDPQSVRIMLSGRNVTADTEIDPRSFTYRAPLPPGRHTVDVTARDRAGNGIRRTWSFEVGAAAPASVPIRILSHTDKGQVDGNVVHVRARAAPFASVNVRADAVPPVIGQFGVAQQVYSRTIQADRNGDFDFSFNSPFPVPGTRYDIQMTATKADVTNEARLTLYQRQG